MEGLRGRQKIKTPDKKFRRPCGKYMVYHTEGRCDGFHVPECEHYQLCLNFFIKKNWPGWKKR